MVDEQNEICGARIVDKSKRGQKQTYFRLELWLRTENAELGDRIRYVTPSSPLASPPTDLCVCAVSQAAYVGRAG